VHYLISKGADVNQNCYFEESPLVKAVKKRNITLVKYLVENKADVNAIGYFNKNVAEYTE
jgi:ankyrin repeat protein